MRSATNSLKKANKSQSFSIGDQIELYIDRLSYGGGRGVGRKDDFVFFVENVAPEETVLAQVTEIKRRFAEAKLIEVLKPSIHRRQPPCPIFYDCGGCVWQHISYDQQIIEKQDLLRFQIEQLCHSLDVPLPVILPLKASETEFRYRNRIQLHSQNGIVGYHKRGTNEVIAVEDCLIAEQELIEEMHRYLRSAPSPKRRFEIARTFNNDIKLIERDVAQPDVLFSQVNSSMNQYLVEHVVHWSLQVRPAPKRIYDLYSGAGNFTFPLANVFPTSQISGVELSRTSVNVASKRLKQEGHKNIGFTASDVGLFLERLKEMPNSLALLDPPRPGCDDRTIKNLIRLRPNTIISISCNLSTFTRDLKKLIQSGYTLKEIKGFDMFPQTDYMECTALLSS